LPKFRLISVFIFGLLLAATALAQQHAARYAVFLRDAPVAQRFSTRAELQSASGIAYRQDVESAQRALRTALAARKVVVTGSVSTLLNAVFVAAAPGRVAELKAMPGVADVVPLRRHEAMLSRAVALMNGPQAWALTPGGASNAGAGIKIAILDTGIDQTHPALQDASLPMPAGYPKCSGSDCDFTSNKVIVARSYVRQLGAGTDPANPAADSRPDDYSPRDHMGHGTATASTAAGNTATGTVTVSGIAPKAYLGNYKILGSPTVNDGTYDDIMLMALEDALSDGMDIVSMSVAGPAVAGPLDTGATCGRADGVPCDLAAWGFEMAAQKGMTIVVAAGNSGGNGTSFPLYSSINSPADAPSVIAAGATTNSHDFSGLVEMTGAGAPSNLQAIPLVNSDSFASGGGVTGPLVDVAQLGDNGLACAALPGGSLNSAVALILRGGCSFSTKMGNATDAGASAVIFYMADALSPINPTGLGSFIETAVMVSNADGNNLKTFVDVHANSTVTIDPSGVEVSGAVTPNRLASFSSFGPGLGTGGIKPDLLAVGESLYMPSQNYDPLGEMFSSTRYIFAAGTSFSTPLIAGAAALVKQNHPGYTGAQIRSALVNTASQDITRTDGNSPVTFLETGPGKLAADAAVMTTVTVSPATLSFGILTAGALAATQQMVVTNNGATAVNLSLAVTPGAAGAPAPALDQQSLALAPGAGKTITVSLSGAGPLPGVYNGAITITGGSVPLRVAYMYLIGSGSPANLQVISGDFDDATVGQVIPDGTVAFQITDSIGIPVANAPVSFTADAGVTLSQVSATTDRSGVAEATVTMGPIPGQYSVTASSTTGARLRHTFTEYSRAAPLISAAGVVNAASYTQPVAPGSYITIFGTGLYDPDLTATGQNLVVSHTLRLPIALDYTMVSFDVPGANPPVSAPGRMYYVSAGQIALQVPWELQGQSSAQMKVTVDLSYGNVVTVPISDYAPGFFLVGNSAAATNESGVIGAANPAVRGHAISLYVNGLGPVDNPVPSGEPTPLAPYSQTIATPEITIGGKPARVLFSGLAPQTVGLYQINVLVPDSSAAGTQAVTLSIGGQAAKSTVLAVQ
jgi:minor extracellular serine protease Vpr